MLTDAVKGILSHYESDSPGTKANLARILMAGRLGGTGKVVILPVDQGSEHGPAKSFAVNPDAYDPHYHFRLAIEAQLNALAAPLGLLETGASSYAGCLPTILKVNNSNSLFPAELPKDQAVTGSVKDALRLGCSAIGLTIYPGAPKSYDMIEEARELIAEAKQYGLASVVWSYPRDGDLSSKGETAIDVVGYATHVAALIGAHIIKVKLPSEHIEQKGIDELYGSNCAITSQSDRVKHIMQCAFLGKRIVVFSGGSKKGENVVFEDAQAILAGGGHGSIIGRNSFQREKSDAITMLSKVIQIYENKN